MVTCRRGSRKAVLGRGHAGTYCIAEGGSVWKEEVQVSTVEWREGCFLVRHHSENSLYYRGEVMVLGGEKGL